MIVIVTYMRNFHINEILKELGKYHKLQSAPLQYIILNCGVCKKYCNCEQKIRCKFIYCLLYSSRLNICLLTDEWTVYSDESVSIWERFAKSFH